MQNTTETGLMINNMAKELKLGLMEQDIKVFMLEEENTVKESFVGQMVLNLKEILMIII